MSMNELVKIVGQDIFTNSIVIANGTGNEHRAVQQLIRNYENDINDFGKITFQMLPLESGQKTKLYMLNEQQATFIIALMKNTRIVVDFKKELVRQFYQMRELLLQKQSIQWQQTRLESKRTRRLEAEEIKQLVQYAKGQGSKNSEKYYITLSKLANKTV